MPQKAPKVQNTNTYQMVINLTGKQNEAIQEARLKETNSLTYHPGPKYTQPWT